MVVCKPFIFGILLLTVLKQVNSDEGLSHRLSNKNIYEMVPQLWHLYVKTFLYKMISKSHLFTVEKSICHLDKDIRLFLQYCQKQWLKPVHINCHQIIRQIRISGCWHLCLSCRQEILSTLTISATCCLYLDSSDGCPSESTFKI